MPEDKNMTCSHMPNSLRNQPKKSGHLASSELDYPREAEGKTIRNHYREQINGGVDT